MMADFQQVNWSKCPNCINLKSLIREHVSAFNILASLNSNLGPSILIKNIEKLVGTIEDVKFNLPSNHLVAPSSIPLTSNVSQIQSQPEPEHNQIEFTENDSHCEPEFLPINQTLCMKRESKPEEPEEKLLFIEGKVDENLNEQLVESTESSKKLSRKSVKNKRRRIARLSYKKRRRPKVDTLNLENSLEKIDVKSIQPKFTLSCTTLPEVSVGENLLSVDKLRSADLSIKEIRNGRRKRFECRLCQTTSYQRCDLRLHVRRKHYGDRFPCPANKNCHEKFYDSKAVRRHLMKCHQPLPLTSPTPTSNLLPNGLFIQNVDSNFNLKYALSAQVKLNRIQVNSSEITQKNMKKSQISSSTRVKIENQVIDNIKESNCLHLFFKSCLEEAQKSKETFKEFQFDFMPSNKIEKMETDQLVLQNQVEFKLSNDFLNQNGRQVGAKGKSKVSKQIKSKVKQREVMGQIDKIQLKQTKSKLKVGEKKSIRVKKMTPKGRLHQVTTQKSEKEYESARKMVQKQNDGKFKCRLCKKIYATQTTGLNHCRLVHLRLNRKYCVHCPDQDFQNNFTLERHKMRFHGGQVRIKIER